MKEIVALLVLLILYWIRALPDRPFGSQTRLIGQHSTKDKTGCITNLGLVRGWEDLGGVFLRC